MVNFLFLLITTAWGLMRMPKYKVSPNFKLGDEYKTLYYTQPVDHVTGDPGIFNVKVLFREGDPKGPLFVYTGNEGPIEAFYEITGWLVDYLAPKYNANVAFIEHRYYGSSKISPLNYKYLTTTQALWDFADITTQLKPSNSTRVVAFGGSYGGMLSAMFRIKYPSLVDGAIASSAPLLMHFLTGNEFANKTSQIYKEVVNEECASNVYRSLEVLTNMIHREDYFSTLELIFKPCQKIDEVGEVSDIRTWISDALVSIAQFSYPYEASVYGPLPPYPTRTVCSLLAKANEDQNVWSSLKGLYEVANMFYNGTQTQTCFDIYTGGGSDAQAWEYQTCSELVMPIGYYGYPNDMFYNDPWTYENWVSYCEGTYGVSPQNSTIELLYGMSHNTKSSLQYVSNIIFSWGSGDPWSVGCFQEDIDSKNIVLEIKNASHHYDLRQPNFLDTSQVKIIRNLEEERIKLWANLS